MMDDAQLDDLSQRCGVLLADAGLRLAAAESCTGGWVAKTVTDIAGSSRWFVCGFTTYSNEAKIRMLGVAPDTLAKNGAVSEATAHEMATGALLHSEADVALSVTGIAGPDGGSEEKPVGTVCFAWARRAGSIKTETRRFNGNREQVRRRAVEHALTGLIAFIGDALC